MEYVQMTLNDWVRMKQKLKQELLGVKQSFVRIGYALRKIEDQRLYEQDGYKSIAEFAQAEYGMGPSITSRFMSINREYSIDGYSELLRPEYEDLGRSQLEEMLKLPERDRQMIQPETSREDIRELKRFNKAEPEAGVADDLRQLVEKFYHDNAEILNEVFRNPEYDELTIKRFAEIVNPGGNRSYKKGLYFLMMYENRVVIKKFGTDPQDLTWWDFWQITQDIFGELAAGPKTWQNYFGGNEDGETEQGGKECDMESGSVAGDGKDHVQQAPEDSGRHQEGADDQPSELEGSRESEDDGGANGKESDDIEQEAEKGAGRNYGAADKPGTAGAEDDASGEESSEGDRAETEGGQIAEPGGTESQGEEIAPAQETEENTVNTESDMDRKVAYKQCTGCRFHYPESPAREMAYEAVCKECEGAEHFQARPENLTGAQEAEPDQEEQIPGQDNIMNHPEYLPEGVKPEKTKAAVDGEPVHAQVEPTKGQVKEDALAYLSMIQGNIGIENYRKAREQGEHLLETLKRLEGYRS